MDEKGRKAAFYTSRRSRYTSYNFARGYIKFLLTPKNHLSGGQTTKKKEASLVKTIKIQN